MEAYLNDLFSLVETLPAGGEGCSTRFLGACRAIAKRLRSLREGLPCSDKAAQLKSLLG